MDRIDHTREGPNIAGVSLALYLLVSILSMMAAYDFKASDDVRNSAVIHLQSSYGAPSKSSDDGGNDPFLALSIEPVAVDRRPVLVGAFLKHLQSPTIASGFQARGPPLALAPAA